MNKIKDDLDITYTYSIKFEENNEVISSIFNIDVFRNFECFRIFLHVGKYKLLVLGEMGIKMGLYSRLNAAHEHSMVFDYELIGDCPFSIGNGCNDYNPLSSQRYCAIQRC